MASNMTLTRKPFRHHTSGGKKNFRFKPFIFKCVAKEKRKTEEFEEQSGDSPLPRSGHRIVADNGSMFSYGGYLENNINNFPNAHLFQQLPIQTLFEELWKFNNATKTWKLMETEGVQPKELASHAALLDGRNLIVYGGTGVPFGGCSSNKMYICNLETLSWKQLMTTGEVPSPQYGQAIYLDKQKKSIYVCGGTTGHHYTLDVHKLNLNTFEWESLFITKGQTTEPAPRYRHEIAFENGNIFVIGGGTATSALDLVTISSFNLESRSWKSIKTIGDPKAPGEGGYPGPRKCHSLIQRGSDVFICGGFDSVKIYPDIWKLDLKTFKWNFFPSLILHSPVYFHSAACTDEGCMYIFGGVTNIKKNIRTNRVLQVWLTIPSLKEICWEAILHYNPKINSNNRNALLSSGVPVDFVNRL